jgi:hypothetical protein
MTLMTGNYEAGHNNPPRGERRIVRVHKGLMELPQDETLFLPQQTLLELYSSSSSNWSAWERKIEKGLREGATMILLRSGHYNCRSGHKAAKMTRRSK